MKNIVFNSNIATQGEVIDTVFTAFRAWRDTGIKNYSKDGYRVTFVRNTSLDLEYVAVVFRDDECIGYACVDEFDL